MTERRLLNPASSPDHAAQEVIVELCQAQAFGIGPQVQARSREEGEAIAEAIIAAHEKLAEYYRSLKSR